MAKNAFTEKYSLKSCHGILGRENFSVKSFHGKKYVYIGFLSTRLNSPKSIHRQKLCMFILVDISISQVANMSIIVAKLVIKCLGTWKIPYLFK